VRLTDQMLDALNRVCNGPCSLGPATDWNARNGVTDVEIVALPVRP